MRWTDIPIGIQTAKDLKRPAPAVELTAAIPRPAMYMAGDIMLLQPWSRATPPGATTGVGYLTVMNHGSSPDTLLGGSTPVAAKLEIHQTLMTGGIVTMRPAPEGVTIPPGAAITLKPEGGGYHIMLSGLKTPLKTGSPLPATLNFAKAGPVHVEFSVEAIGALAPATHGEHNQPPK
jgi:copper(I)-binding protein